MTINIALTASLGGARAEDRLDLTVLLGLHAVSVTKSCKASVAYANQKIASRLIQARYKLELQLSRLQSAKKTFTGYFKQLSAIRAIKAKLVSLNERILDWMRTTTKFYSLKFADMN